MAISIKCLCSATFEVPPSFAGKTAMCPGCGEFHDVPRDGRSVDKPQERKAAAAAVVAAAEEKYPPREIEKMIRNAFEGEIPPVRRTVGYRLAVTAVAGVMLALPLIYLALIGLVGFLVYWHITHNYTVFRSIRIWGALVVYIGPIVIGLVLLVFMVRPLLARPARARRSRPIRMDKEYLLAQFVDEIAEVVHAPRPTRIEIDGEVNAAASYGTSLWSIFGRNLTLRIGMPLVYGLRAEQLAGIIAHEFGHFAQGAGMRMSFVVSAINAWFYRVVYERDVWDEDLVEWTKEGGVFGLIASAIQICVMLTRGFLWVLMMIGHGLSSYLLRRMEFDADRSQGRLVGLRVFEKTWARVAVLSAAAAEATEIVLDCWIKEKFPDDFAALVVGLAKAMPTHQRDDILEELEAERTGVFDSHPSYWARRANIEKDDPPGVMDLDLPATALFRQLPKLAEAVSMDHYRSIFGGGLHATLRPVADYLEKRVD